MSTAYTVKMPQKNKKPNVTASLGTGKTKKKKDSENLLDYYKTKGAAAEESYRSASNALSKSTEEKLRRAAVSYDLLKKYLPIENERAGLTGLGVSESAGIEARNGYARRVGEIESAHAEEKAALDATYQKEKSALAEHYAKSKSESEALAVEKEKQVRDAQDQTYRDMLELMRNEEFGSVRDLEDLLAEIKPHVRREQYATLAHYVRYYKNNSDFSSTD